MGQPSNDKTAPSSTLANKTNQANLQSRLKITAQLKARMMYEGTLMIGYQPLGQVPNFFRSIISNSAVQKHDIDFMLSELDRLGADL